MKRSLRFDERACGLILSAYAGPLFALRQIVGNPAAHQTTEVEFVKGLVALNQSRAAVFRQRDELGQAA
jgi:hypothetical protein